VHGYGKRGPRFDSSGLFRLAFCARICAHKKRRAISTRLTDSFRYGRDRDRTDDLYRVKVALIPTELRARRIRFYNLSGSGRPAFFMTHACSHADRFGRILDSTTLLLTVARAGLLSSAVDD
jgi:hypothetical protein